LSAPLNRENAVLVGIISAPHGIAGAVSTESLSDNPRRFTPGAEFFDQQGHNYLLEEAKPHQGRLLLRFRGIADRNAAEKLRGVQLYIIPAADEQAPAGTYYHYQLAGLEVREKGAVLGVIEDIFSHAANDVFLVRQPDGGEILVPALKQMVKKIDLTAGYLEVELPEGLV
jgi:16S rRNA processing protein RimM